jgi:predicted alpha/beta-fold hydrolase
VDDPLLGVGAFPREVAAASEALHLEMPAHGGHVGFLDRRRPWRSWVERRVPEFLLPWLGR